MEEEEWAISDKVALTAFHEGLQLRVYRCPAGYLTVGYGRNLEGKGITKREAKMLLLNDIEEAEIGLTKYLPWWRHLDEVRQAVLSDMAVNLGVRGLMQFVRMLEALRRGEHLQAAVEMVNSRWYSQVGDRSGRLVDMMVTGQWPKGG